MTRSRFVVFSSFSIVAVGALAALGALFLDPARAAVGPLPATALCLPADTRFVIGWDVQRFTASPFYRRLPRQEARPDVLRVLEEKTGLDPERDLDRVVLTGAGRGREGTVALAFGRFDRTKIVRAIETEVPKDVTWKSHHGTTLYFFKENMPGAGALAFLSDDTVVVGSQPAVETVIASHTQGRQPLRANAALIALLEQVKTGSTFWMVGDQSLLANLPKTIPAPGAAPGSSSDSSSLTLPALKSLIVTGDLEPLIALEITGEATDEAAARNLADIVRGFVALVQLQARQKPELQNLASAVSVTTETTRVHVNARVPYEMLDALQPKKATAAPEVSSK